MSDNPIIVTDKERKKRPFVKLSNTMKKEVVEGDAYTFWYVPEDSPPEGAKGKYGGYFIVTVESIDGKVTIGMDFARITDFIIQISQEFLKRHPEAMGTKKPTALKEFGVV